MKHLLPLIALALLCLPVTQALAQTFGLKAGLNISNMLFEDDDDTYSDDFDALPGFHAGVAMELPFTNILSLETALQVSTKGFEFMETESGFEVTSKTTPLYIDVPITLKATNDLGGASIYGLAGPYIGFGVGGEVKAEASGGGIGFGASEDIEWGNDEDEDTFKPFDFGVLLGGGVQIGSFQVGVSYALGLANISPYTDFGTKIANRVFSVSAGYWFGENTE